MSIEDYPWYHWEQPGEPERPLDMEIAPAAPPDADTQDGVAYRMEKWRRIMEADAFFREVRQLADTAMGVDEQQPTDQIDGGSL